MDAKKIVTFIRFIRENPDLAHDREKFTAEINRAGDELIKLKTELLRLSIEAQKEELAECFDIWEKFTKENNIDIFHAGETEIEKFIVNAVKAFGLEEKEGSNAEQD